MNTAFFASIPFTVKPEWCPNLETEPTVPAATIPTLLGQENTWKHSCHLNYQAVPAANLTYELLPMGSFYLYPT